jgi:hypothetical protein
MGNLAGRLPIRHDAVLRVPGTLQDRATEGDSGGPARILLKRGAPSTAGRARCGYLRRWRDYDDPLDHRLTCFTWGVWLVIVVIDRVLR